MRIRLEATQSHDKNGSCIKNAGQIIDNFSSEKYDDNVVE